MTLCSKKPSYSSAVSRGVFDGFKADVYNLNQMHLVVVRIESEVCYRVSMCSY